MQLSGTHGIGEAMNVVPPGPSNIKEIMCSSNCLQFLDDSWQRWFQDHGQENSET